MIPGDYWRISKISRGIHVIKIKNNYKPDSRKFVTFVFFRVPLLERE